jgi:hypothetical protein
MGLFDRKPKEITVNENKTMSTSELRKQLELAEKLEEEQKRKELEKKQFNEVEDVEDFLTDDEVDDTDLTKEIEKFVENNGAEQTINFLYSIITRLNIQLVVESLEQDQEEPKQEDESEIEFKE